jgi:hypothetical protein
MSNFAWTAGNQGNTTLYATFHLLFINIFACLQHLIFCMQRSVCHIFAYWHYLILILDSCINLFCKSKISPFQLADPFLMNWLFFRAGEKSSFSCFYKDITWWNVQLHLSDSKHPSGFFRVNYNNMAVLYGIIFSEPNI